MPKFMIEQYELHMTENVVEADSPAAAVKLLLGKPSLGNNRDDCSQFLGGCRAIRHVCRGPPGAG